MSTTTTVNAIVAYDPTEPGKPNWKYEALTIKRTEPGPNEVLVRMLASGICHTDIFCGTVPDGMYGKYPKVLGHEGSGYVEAIGSKVTTAAVGDPVLLSYTSCGTCDLCTTEQPTYCQSFDVLNGFCHDRIWTQPSSSQDVGGKFFGQSSFASLSLVDEASIVNVKDLVKPNDRDDLKMLSPLGCGLMTGSGAVINTAKAGPSDAILVIGLGAVGLSIIMTAKIQKCHTIIAVDRIASRLKLAQELGATHILDATPYDISSETYATNISQRIKSLTGADPPTKITYTFDTTGFLPVISACVRSLSKRGKHIQIGVPVIKNPPHDSVLQLDMMDFFGGTKRMEINYLGDCRAREQVPRMIGWWREGVFPFERFVRFFGAGEIEGALEGMKGDVVKPVIVH